MLVVMQDVFDKIPVQPESWLQYGTLGALALYFVMDKLLSARHNTRIADSHDKNTDRMVDAIGDLGKKMDGMQQAVLFAAFREKGTVIPLPPPPPQNGRGDSAFGGGS